MEEPSGGPASNAELEANPAMGEEGKPDAGAHLQTTPSVKSIGPGGESVVPKGRGPSSTPGKMPDAVALLDKLRSDVEAKGGQWQEGWRVEVRQRTGGTTAGTFDAYYYSPANKKFRSRNEVIKQMGLGQPASPLTKFREQAAEAAAAAAASITLPITLPTGVVVTRLGALDSRPKYHTETALFPLGYEARFTDAKGAMFMSTIRDGGDVGPLFCVTLQPPDTGLLPHEIASEQSPEAVWRRAAELQRAINPIGRPKKAQKDARADGMDGQGTQKAHSPCGDKAAGLWNEMLLDGSSGQAEPRNGLPNGTAASQHQDSAVVPVEDAPDPPEATGSGEAPAAGKGKKVAGRGMNVVDGLSEGACAALAAVATLRGISGLQMFGLTATEILQALEGLPGVADLPGYKFVEERGTWEAEITRLQKAAGNRLRSPMPKEAKPAAPRSEGKRERLDQGGGKQGGGKRKRSEGGAGQPKEKACGKKGVQLQLGPNLSLSAPFDIEPGAKKRRKKGEGKERKKDGVSREVRGVVNRLLNKVVQLYEREEAREERKMAKHAEKEAAAAAKKAEKQGAKAQAKAQGKAGSVVAAPKAAVALPAMDVEDSLLPGAKNSPPQAAPLPGAHAVPAALMPGVVELWQLLGRLREHLQMAALPDLRQLATGLACPGGHEGPLFAECMTDLVERVAYEAFDAALELAQADFPDLAAVDHSPAFPTLKEDTWGEMARRVLALAAAGEMVHASDGAASGGPDVALGAFVGASPLAVLGPAVILQGLMTGSLGDAADSSIAALPVGACKTAPSAVLARKDARSAAVVERALAGTAGDRRSSGTVAIACRRILLDLASNVKGPKTRDGRRSSLKTLNFRGAEAALAARSANTLDIHTVAARVDQGVYDAMDDGLNAFAADVRMVCATFRAAAKRQSSIIGAELRGARAGEAADLVQAALESLLLQHAGRVTGITSPHAGQGRRRKIVEDTDSEDNGGEGDEGSPNGSKSGRDFVEDMSRPFAPWEGCSVCWQDEDRARIILCDACNEEVHTYCLEPALDHVPTGEWYCSSCIAEGRGGGRNVITPAKEKRRGPAAVATDYQHAAALLGMKSWEELSVGERVAVAGLLASLLVDSGDMRGHLEETLEGRKALRKEAFELRTRLKREEKEREEARKEREAEAREKQDKGKGKGVIDESDYEPRRRTRADEEAERETRDALKQQERLAQLDAQLKLQFGGVREEPLGYDRHWRRYWLLGHFDADHLGFVAVEPRGGNAPREDCPALVASQSGTAVMSPLRAFASPQNGAQEWGVYPAGPALDALIQFLNPRGAREGPLLKRLRGLQQQQNSGGIPNGAGGATDMDVDPAPALSGSQPESRSLEAPVTGDAVPNSNGQPGVSGEHGSAEDTNLPQPHVSAGASELLALLEQLGLESSAGGTGWASPERIRRLRILLSDARSPQDLMAALLALEKCVPVERLRPWWRLWSFPSPHPDQGTLAAVRTRLSALRAALKRGFAAAAAREAQNAPAKVAPEPRQSRYKEVALPEAASGPRGYRLREKRAAVGALAEAALQGAAADSGAEESEDGEPRARQRHRHGRTTRLSRRLQEGGDEEEAGEEDAGDEALAKRLHRELNALQGGRRNARVQDTTAKGPTSRAKQQEAGSESSAEPETLPIAGRTRLHKRV